MPQSFNLNKENDQKLWVKTPFPVTHAVWNFFVKGIFPGFVNVKASPPGRYINRSFWGDTAELTDGQLIKYRTHAFLPDDKRKGVNSAEWGLIYVPEVETRYLDNLVQTLQRPSDTAMFLL